MTASGAIHGQGGPLSHTMPAGRTPGGEGDARAAASPSPYPQDALRALVDVSLARNAGGGWDVVLARREADGGTQYWRLTRSAARDLQARLGGMLTVAEHQALLPGVRADAAPQALPPGALSETRAPGTSPPGRSSPGGDFLLDDD